MRPPITELPLLSDGNQSRANPDFLSSRAPDAEPKPHPAKRSFSCPLAGAPYSSLRRGLSLAATRDKPSLLSCRRVFCGLWLKGTDRIEAQRWWCDVLLSHNEHCPVGLQISFDSWGESALYHSSNSSVNVRRCVNFRWFFPLLCRKDSPEGSGSAALKDTDQLCSSHGVLISASFSFHLE